MKKPSQNFYLSKRTENRIYYYGVRNSEGKISWRTTGTKIKSEALKVIRDINQPPKQEEKKTSELLFSEFIKMFNTSHSMNVRPKTTKSYEWVVKEFQSIVGDRPLIDYTPMDFETFKRAVMDRKISLYGSNHYIQNIKTVFRFAKSYDFLQKDPSEKLSICRIPEQKPLFFSKEEITKLFNSLSAGTIKDVVTFAYYTGCRLGEILNLTWDCVDWERKLIRVQNTETFTTKTKREREIPQHSEVEKLLLRRKGLSRFNYVFCKENGMRYDGCYISRCTKKQVTDLKLNPKLRFHSLRHSFASMLAINNVSIYSISKLLGHSQVSTTQRYAHLNPAQLNEEVNRISI